MPILATFDAYANAQGITAGVRQEWRRAIERLVAFVGHDDAARLSTQDIMRWRDQLLEEPSSRGGPRVAKTVRGKYISAIRAMLGWAVEEQKLRTNVAAAVVVRGPKKPKLRERDFTADEVRAILSAALEPVEGRLAPGHVLARRWIPWLCAYTGVRV
ncbi:MAG: recombinase XerD, partial [Sphingomonas bacterium]|nr:recombinase XerD [Sphingomonas bacterium]